MADKKNCYGTADCCAKGYLAASSDACKGQKAAKIKPDVVQDTILNQKTAIKSK